MKTFNFPEFKQTCRYDCGACALESVFAYYGADIFEEDIMKIAGTIPKKGTPMKGMLKAIKHYRFKGELKRLDIKKLRNYIDKKCPVILRLQAWSQHKETNWEKDWKDGHYVVVVGYDNEKIYFEDPWTINRTFLTNNELLVRWHDIGEDGTKYINDGIVMTGRRKDVKSVPIHMD